MLETSLERIKNYIKIIKESGIPVKHLTSIDISGKFTVEMPQSSNDYSVYKGKIIRDGLLAINESGFSYPSDIGVNTDTKNQTLIAYNINEYSFKASVDHMYSRHDIWGIKDIDSRRINANDTIIESLYSHYYIIVKALNNGADDDFIKTEFGLDSFESTSAHSKTR